MKEDRHRASYIPFRCSQETSELITQLAHQEHRPKSEVLRDLVDKGLVASGLKADEDYLNSLVRSTVQEVMKPHVERLAAISAKATQISGAGFFMGMYAAMLRRSPAEQQEIQDAAGQARELGIQYLKLKDRDIDAFIQEGVKSMKEEN